MNFKVCRVSDLSLAGARNGAAALGLVAVLVLACGGCLGQAQDESRGQVRGQVVDVVGRNITEVESLRIRDEDGRIWSFTGDEGYVGSTPSHLREHQLLSLSVLVSYVENSDGKDSDGLVAVHIAD